MKYIKRLFILLISFITLIFGCANEVNSFVIEGGDLITIEVGEVYQLEVSENNISDNISWSSIGDYIEIDENGLVTAVSVGKQIVIASFKYKSDEIIIEVVEKGNSEIELWVSKYEVEVGEELVLETNVNNAKFIIVSGSEFCEIANGVLKCKKNGVVVLKAQNGNSISNSIIIQIKDKSEFNDPYINVNIEEFYKNYQEATSYMDAYYRSLHGLMSGSIVEQNQEPSVANCRPQENGLFLRNSSANYSDDENTYYILDYKGKIVNEVYKGGAYVTLEEVAAYVFAFGDVPANYSEKKSDSPKESKWGKYLRLNHTLFTGDTKKYPYEPELPNISGCGGDLYYYEIDLGTTGNDCDPKYVPRIYNDGSTITRGASRIVYTRYDKNRDKIIDINEKYLFYTYNHYNDFQEYLNYEGGWGKIFGNITGGGEISNKKNCNPTEYVEVIFKDFSKFNINVNKKTYYYKKREIFVI